MIIEQIKKDRIAAMKRKDTHTSRLLAIIIGHADTTRKTDDESIIKSIGKLIEGNVETLSFIEAGSFDAQRLCQENMVLRKYLPEKLTGEELRETVESLCKELNIKEVKGMGLVMKRLKQTGKLIDGKEVRGYLVSFVS